MRESEPKVVYCWMMASSSVLDRKNAIPFAVGCCFFFLKKNSEVGWIIGSFGQQGSNANSRVLFERSVNNGLF